MPDQNAFSGCIDKWRRQLLDLTGRNRMLQYRPSRATLSIHHDEAHVWDKLVEEGQIELDESSLVPSSSSKTMAARQLEDADKRIKRLSDLARTFLDEQGVHVIYAVFGWLNWVDETRPPLPGEDTVKLRTGREARKVRSPLLFVPVTLERTTKTSRAKYEENAVIETNLALEVFVSQQFGIGINLEPDTDLSPQTVVEAWRTAIKNQERWSVEQGREVIIDSFSFKKVALLRQLERSKDRVGGQSVLRALCGDPQLLLEAPAVPSYQDLDGAALAENLNLVVPADASQLKAILAVQRGVNLVIQGPPGTGKSQTISNIVSTMVAKGKRVLFVAEKRQARGIVVENLSKAGLGEVVLHITEEVLGQRGSSQAKRDIVDQLADILEQGAGEYAVEEDYQADFERVRADLNGYAAKLHTPIGPSPSSTPFRLMAAWAGSPQKLARDLVVPLPSSQEVSEAWKERSFELASRVDDLGDEVLTSANGPWLEAQSLQWDGALETKVTASLHVLIDAPRVLSDLLKVHQGLGDPEGQWTLRRVEDLIELLSAVGEHSEARRHLLGVVIPKFWHTKKAYNRFRSQGGDQENLARDTAGALRNQLHSIRAAQTDIERLFPGHRETEPLSVLAAFAKELLESIYTAPFAMQVLARCLAARELGLHEVFQQLVRSRPPGERLRDMLEASLSKWWAQEASKSDPCFSNEGPALNRQVERLRVYEVKAMLSARAVVLNAVAPYRSSNIDVAPRDSELGILRAQINAKRRKPLRWLFTKSANLILQMKPCVVASPLAVAQFLQAEAYKFDVVIFDEASQIPTADAVVPITRAKQVVIVGDSQQMPPTSFFENVIALVGDDSDDVICESILQECEALLPSLPLTWHYRSLDERLIAFSNQSFYGGKLLTFPSAWLEHPELGVKFVHLPSAVYGRGGSRANPDEANHIIEILKEELTSNPEHEVGVTAMSIAQGSEIQARLEDAALTSPVIRSWLESGGRARNLETVQGDEFDVSILSFGYGRDASGNLQLNFGPLSRDDGYKRLNVAVTRARKKMIVVSSIRGVDIPIGRVSEGGQRVRQFLEYAEHGPSALTATVEISAPGVDTFESPLELEVAREIRALGWSVDTQVGVSRYRVDIGIKHPNYPGRYLAGVECDGATYHSSETARDRDIGRAWVLKNLGWTLFRVWSPDWFKAKDRVLRDLHAFLSRMLEENHDGDNGVRSPKPESSGPGKSGASAPVFRRSESGLRPGTVMYRMEGPQKPPANHGDVAAWTNWLAEKIRIEGPWDKRELALLSQSHLGYANKNILESVARQAADKGILTLRGSTYWHAKNESRFVPVKTFRSGLQRDFAFYSDEELLRAFELACADVGSITKSELVRFIARFLGFARTTNEIRSRLDHLTSRAITDGYIKEDEDNYQAGNHWRDSVFTATPAPYSLPSHEITRHVPAIGRTNVEAPSAQSLRRRSGFVTSQNLPNMARLPVRSLIAAAYREKRALKIRYRNASGQVTNRAVDVLGVGANYFDAFDHLRNEQRTFRVDRVIKAEWSGGSLLPTQVYVSSSWVARGR